MTKQIRVRAIRRREIDEDKLALAFLLLAKVLHEDQTCMEGDTDKEAPATSESSSTSEAA
jgi:hypothetical protein